MEMFYICAVENMYVVSGHTQSLSSLGTEFKIL